MVIRLEILFYGDSGAVKPNFCDRKNADLPPQMTNLHAVIPILMHLFFLLKKYSICTKRQVLRAV